jgi:hypothetical protein
VKEGREEEQREEQGAEEETGCNRTCRQESGGAFTIRSRVFSGATLRSFASQDLPSPPSPSLPRPLRRGPRGGNGKNSCAPCRLASAAHGRGEKEGSETHQWQPWRVDEVKGLSLKGLSLASHLFPRCSW